MISTCIDEGQHWKVIVEPSRKRRAFQALVPKDANPIEVQVFLDSVARTIKLKMSNSEPGGG